MKTTLFARISKDDQYSKSRKEILWEDDDRNRWENEYNKLSLESNAFFIGAGELKGKLLSGKVFGIDKGKSILCNEIEEISCSNDQILQLDEVYPELISRMKAHFFPFIHPMELDIGKIISDIKQKNFISYYIVNGISKYKEIDTLLDNDRIVIIDDNAKFQEVRIYSNGELKAFPEELNIHISVVNLTLDEILEINNKVDRKSKKSNNVNRLEKIHNEIEEKGFYRFDSFFAYYDTLINKKTYKESAIAKAGMHSVLLDPKQSIYKISMSSSEITNEVFNYCNEHNLIIVHKEAPSVAKSPKTQGDVFVNEIKVDDYFYLCRGNDNLELIGKFINEHEKCELESLADQGWVQRSYEIIAESTNASSYNGEQKWWTPNFRSTCVRIPSEEIAEANSKIFEPYFNTTFKRNTENNKQSLSMSTPSLNQILFGPPGTGKTFKTINRALEVLGDSTAGLERKEIRELFNKRMHEGRIVFTTFHQSMNYEDFIEGIKPVEPEVEGEPLIYRIEYGVFRKLCIEASYSIVSSQSDPNASRVLSFSSKFDSYAHDFEERLSKGESVSLKTVSNGKILVDSISSQGNIILKHIGGGRTYTVSKPRLTRLDQEVDELSQIKNINREFRKVIGGSNATAYWAVLNLIRSDEATILESDISDISFEDKKNVVLSLKQSDYSKTKGSPYVLIIDEINRGNVSEIFGELITLIEEDKRLGRPEALEVTLPYSKEKFGVPSNLHIIGTMNTADRSVEAIDTALRRRFSFEEVGPKYDLKELNYEFTGIKTNNLLITINNRLEKLLDKDHTIGHSFFILKENEDASNKWIGAFYQNIIPLLQEFFYGDFGKIGLVLGEGFVSLKETDNSNDLFAEFNSETSSEYEDREVYEIIDYRNSEIGYKISFNGKEVEMNFEKAVRLLMKMKIE